MQTDRRGCWFHELPAQIARVKGEGDDAGTPNARPGEALLRTEWEVRHRSFDRVAEERESACRTIDLPVASHHMLVLEDNALIGMEIEYLLKEQGVAAVSLTWSLQQSLDVLKESTVDGALVDLSPTRSENVALCRMLESMAIPYAVMTAIGERAALHAQLPDVPILAKPFVDLDVRQILDRLG